MTIRPCRSAKCAGDTRQPLAAAHHGADVVQGKSDDPERRLRRSVEEAGDDDACRRDERRRRHHAQHGAEQVRFVLARDRDRARGGAGARSDRRQANSTPWSSNASGTASAATSIAAIAATMAARTEVLLGLERVRQPGVARPGPPQRRQDEQPAAESLPRRVVRHERGDLRDAKTKTRSKNSSSGVTRCSRAAIRSRRASPRRPSSRRRTRS